MEKQHKVPLGNCRPVPSPDVVASEPRPSPFTRSVIARARAECNCVWANLYSGVRPHTITFCACACNNGTRKRRRPGFRGYDVARRKRGPSGGYLARASHAFVAYAELAANGVVYCLPGEYSEIYRRREE